MYREIYTAGALCIPTACTFDPHWYMGFCLHFVCRVSSRLTIHLIASLRLTFRPIASGMFWLIVCLEGKCKMHTASAPDDISSSAVPAARTMTSPDPPPAPAARADPRRGESGTGDPLGPGPRMVPTCGAFSSPSFTSSIVPPRGEQPRDIYLPGGPSPEPLRGLRSVAIAVVVCNGVCSAARTPSSAHRSREGACTRFSFRSYGTAGARHTRGALHCTAKYIPRALYVFQRPVLSTPTGTLVFDYILFAMIRPD